MLKDLTGKFFQSFGGFLLWWILFVVLFGGGTTIPVPFLLNIIGVAVLSALIFAVIYPYFWNYATFIAPIKIIISTVLNLVCGLTSVYLLSSELFALIFPYFWVMFIITSIGHTIGFYFYEQYENKKLATELNQLSK